VGRALAATAAMAFGFLTVFGVFGVLTVSAAWVQRYLPYVTVLIGFALVAIGMWLLCGRELTVFDDKSVGAQHTWAPTVTLGGYSRLSEVHGGRRQTGGRVIDGPRSELAARNDTSLRQNADDMT
jgi:hypothetical protein